MTEPLRRGVVEIETLRRYGLRVPVGTRAVLSVSLYKHEVTRYTPYFRLRVGAGGDMCDVPVNYSAHFPLSFGKGLGGCDVNCNIPWGWGERETIQMEWKDRRGALKPFEGTLAEFALLRVVETLEQEETRGGHPRFRVIRAEWTDG